MTSEDLEYSVNIVVLTNFLGFFLLDEPVTIHCCCMEKSCVKILQKLLLFRSTEKN